MQFSTECDSQPYEFPHSSAISSNFPSQNESNIWIFKLMLSIQSLSWLLKADYKTFVARQDPMSTLSEYNFGCIFQSFFNHQMPRTRFQSAADRLEFLRLEDGQTLVTLCVLCALGKSQMFQSFVQTITYQYPFNGNHAVLLLVVHEHSTANYQYLPLLHGLTLDQIQTIIECLSMLIFFDLSRFVRGEISYWSLVAAKSVQRTLQSGQFVLQQQVLDVFGSYGHIDCSGCMKFTEDAYQYYGSAITQLQQILSIANLPHDHYKKMHTDLMGLQLKWIQWLSIPKSLTSEGTELCLRLMSMMQVSDICDARSMYSAFEKLSETNRQTLLVELTKDCQGISNYCNQGIVLRHSSLILSNVIQRTNQISQETALTVMLTIFASLMQTVETYKRTNAQIGYVEVDISILNSLSSLWTEDYTFIGTVDNLNNVLSKLSLSLIPTNIPFKPIQTQELVRYMVLFKLNTL